MNVAVCFTYGDGASQIDIIDTNKLPDYERVKVERAIKTKSLELSTVYDYTNDIYGAASLCIPHNKFKGPVAVDALMSIYFDE